MDADEAALIAIDVLTTMALDHLEVDEAHTWIAHLKALATEGAAALISEAMADYFQSTTVSFTDLTKE